MHGFDTGDEDSGTAKVFESEHGARDLFDGRVILFNDIVEALRLPQRDGTVSQEPTN